MSKTKLNFAQKVNVGASNFSKVNENQDTLKRKAEIQSEINAHKVSIDYSYREKSDEEKEELKIRKRAIKELN